MIVGMGHSKKNSNITRSKEYFLKFFDKIKKKSTVTP
jgi:hypothetical protein